jgi:hypothetical protein
VHEDAKPPNRLQRRLGQPLSRVDRRQIGFQEARQVTGTNQRLCFATPPLGVVVRQHHFRAFARQRLGDGRPPDAAPVTSALSPSIRLPSTSHPPDLALPSAGLPAHRESWRRVPLATPCPSRKLHSVRTADAGNRLLCHGLRGDLGGAGPQRGRHSLSGGPFFSEAGDFADLVPRF